MRIAVVHNFYRSDQHSGENGTVIDQVTALRRAGHDVLLISQHSDQRSRRVSYPLEAAATVATGIGVSPLAELKHFQPDVTHVHNLFPNFGTHWLRQWVGPVVATLHNFRPLCAAATLFRDGSVCTLCPDGSSLNGVRLGCYRGSKLATLPLAWHTRGSAKGNAVLERADRVILLSQRALDIYTHYGLTRDRLDVVPNFVPSPEGRPSGPRTRKGWLFAGRLCEEKGILELLRAWPENEMLDVVGEGPLRDAAAAIAPSRTRILGSLDHAVLRDTLSGYEALLLPSLWFEGCPLVMLEALSVGTPVIAARGSGAADIVDHFDVGVTVSAPIAAGDVQDALWKVRNDARGLTRRSCEVYHQNFSEYAWLAAITHSYNAATGS